ncbi:hypothetical protein [Paenibacillus sp. 453mf]|uniref:hypothetical protein n=1 Tax=Paenibacillus sp. 453mf TaxID=1761874 RepID=UPI0008F2B3C0|nr:hypothetical protein [Paenibacillus sp. 453mf]SFS49636.1 hypothetical protein SAMN04488601_1011128 [Paenibacillus sp. 453mf]
MLDIYYDIDVESFDKVFVLPILNDYLDFLGDISVVQDLELQYKQYTYLKIMHVGRTKTYEEIQIDNSYESVLEGSNLYDGNIVLISEGYSILEESSSRKDNYVRNILCTTRYNEYQVIGLLLSKNSSLLKYIEVTTILSVEDHPVDKDIVMSYLDDVSLLKYEELEVLVELLKSYFQGFNYYKILEKQLIVEKNNGTYFASRNRNF